jgi:hypothetical protein
LFGMPVSSGIIGFTAGSSALLLQLLKNHSLTS